MWYTAGRASFTAKQAWFACLYCWAAVAARALRSVAAAAAVPAAAALPRAASDEYRFHTVFAADCSAYHDWQSIGIVYSHRKAGVPGPITRILTCGQAELAGYQNVGIVPTHVSPSWTFNPHNNDSYLAYNKPGGLWDWLEKAPPKENWVLVLDPDMIIRDSFTDWPRVYGAGRGWAISVWFGYMQGVANNLSATHVPEIAPRNDTLAGPEGRRGDQVSGVVFMHRDDLAAVAPLWHHYSEVVRDDPSAWNETGDEYANQPGRKPWIAEMYGYSFGAAKAGVWHHVDMMSMLYPGYVAYDKPMILHYGREFDIGPFKFQKHWLRNFNPSQCPPWPHMEAPLTGPEAAAHVSGGLFPHPPHPSTFAGLPVLEEYQQLLSVEVVAVLNAALCERHLANCPASQELSEQCSQAQQLERDVDAAIKRVEAAGPPSSEPICKDRKTECKEWADNQQCLKMAGYMHYYCRETCRLCRLPAGRPQPAFDWSGGSVSSSKLDASKSGGQTSGSQQKAAKTSGSNGSDVQRSPGTLPAGSGITQHGGGTGAARGTVLGLGRTSRINKLAAGRGSWLLREDAEEQREQQEPQRQHHLHLHAHAGGTTGTSGGRRAVLFAAVCGWTLLLLGLFYGLLRAYCRGFRLGASLPQQLRGRALRRRKTASTVGAGGSGSSSSGLV